MGLRFRRSIKIVPGVRVNLGKKGASVSVGRRGANVTVGKTGVRTTVGLPGTGLSHTTLHRRNSAGATRNRPKRDRRRPIILFCIAFLLLVLLAVFT